LLRALRAGACYGGSLLARIAGKEWGAYALRREMAGSGPRLSAEIEALARSDSGCERLMSVPGVGPIISSAMVAAIGTGDVFSKGRDFGAWLGLVPKQI
jgi:transposase